MHQNPENSVAGDQKRDVLAASRRLMRPTYFLPLMDEVLGLYVGYLQYLRQKVERLAPTRLNLLSPWHQLNIYAFGADVLAA